MAETPVAKIKETRDSVAANGESGHPMMKTGWSESSEPSLRPSACRCDMLEKKNPAHDFASMGVGTGAGLRGFCVSAQNLAISSLAMRVRSGEPSM